MADEEDTREVLFQDWEGPDKTGLTIEHTSGGELLVKEVKGESPAARSGKVYEGDQIVGATIYFENMSSEETAELLKTLNKHKVGLKLQNKGDKSPCYSPLSTPCRSPMGTLTWEGKSQFGASSPEIILSGDDEDYKRIYTKKIKPRLKSEDLAEGVDVRTERHSSTSSDGSTITTITRRITTYTVDMPSGIGEKQELSSSDFKGQRHDSGDGSPRVRILHGSPTVKGVGEEGVFETCNVTYSGLKGSSTETNTSGDQSKIIIREGTEGSKDLRFKGPKFGVIGHEGTKILRESEEQTAGRIDESEKQTTSGESKSTFMKVVTVGGSANAELTTNDENKRSASLSLPQEDIKIQRASGDTSLHLNKGSSYFDVKTVGKSADPGMVTLVTETNINTGYSSHPDRSSLTSRQTTLPSAKPKSGEKDEGVPAATKVEFRCPDVNTERKEGDLKLPHINTSSLKTTSQGSSEVAIKYQEMDSDVDKSQVTDNDGFHFKTRTRTEIDTRSKGKADMSDSKVGVDVRMPEINLNLKGSTIKGNVDVESVRTAVAEREDFESKDGFPLSQIKMPSVKSKDQKLDVRGKSRKTENDMEITQPKTKTDVKYTEVGAPVITIPSISGPKMSMPDVDINLKGPKLKADMDVSGPKIKGDIKSPEIDIKSPEVDVEGPKGGFEMPKMKMSSINLKGSKVDVPDVNLNLKGPKVGGDVDVNLPKIKGDLKGPEVDIEGPDVDIEGHKGGLKMPKFKMPSFGFKGPKLEGPDVDIEGHKGGLKMPKFKMPSFGFKGPKLEGPDVDIDLPKADIDVKAPDFDIEGADLDIKGPNAKLKGPKFNMPSLSGPKISMPDVDFNLKGPKLKGDMDVSGPKIKGDIKSPEIDIKGPEVDIEGPKGGFEMPKMKMPSLNLKGPKVDMPDVDINLKGPKVEGDVDVNLPKIKGDLKGPEVDIEGPDVDIEGHKGGLKMPKFKMPSFGFKGPKLEGPDVDIDLPKADIDVKAPDVDFEGADLDIKGPNAKLKGPKFNMPSLSGPKISMPDVDFNLKGPKLKGDMDVSGPKIKGDIKSPEIDIKGPEVDIEGPKGGFEMPKMKMPSLNLKGPKVDMPDVDINLKGPKVEGDVDVNLPKIKGDLKGPEVDIEGPDVDIEGHKGGLKMPKFKMPSFGFKGPKVEGPDVDINLPKADIDVKAPDVDIEGADLDIKGPNAKLKGPKFNMPSISGPKLSMPDVDFNMKGPKLKGDMDVSGPKIKGDMKSPEIDIKGPEVDIEGPKGGFEMPKMKMPSLNLKGPKVEMPDVDINLKGPKVESDVNVKMPKIKGDLKGPEVDIEGSDIDIEGHKGGLKMPKFKMPSFDLKGSKLEGPDVDIDLPKADIDVKAPDVDIKGADLDIKGPNAKLKGPKFNIPSISGPKISMPDMDFNLKGPKLKGDMDVSGPNLKGDIKSHEIDIKGTKVKTDVPSLDFDLKHSSEPPKFPTIPGSKATLSNVDVHLKGSKLKGEFKGEGQFPKAELKATDVLEVSPKKSKFKMPKVGFKSPKIKTSEPDIKLEHGDVNIKGKTGSREGLDFDIGLSGSKSKSPKFKIPKFGLKGPKVDMPEADLSKSEIDIKTSDVTTAGAGFDVDIHSGKLKGSKDVDLNLTGPKLKGDLNVSVPDVDLNLKEADIKGPKFEVEGPKGGLEMSKIKIPSFGIKLPQLEKSNDTINIPNVKADTVTPKVDIGGVDVKGPEASPNAKLPSVSGPTLPDLNINLSRPKTKGNVNITLPKTDTDIKVPKTEIKGAGKITPPEVDIKGPHVDLEGGKDGFEIPKIKMPSLDFKGPKTGSQGVDINLSKAKIDVDSSTVDFKAPKVKLPTVSGPEWDISLKGSNVEGKEINVNLPKTDIDIKGPKLSMSDVDMNLKAPDVDIKDPEVHTGGPKVGFKMSKVTLPSESEVDVNFPKADLNIKAPEVNIKGPEFGSTEASLDVPDIDVKGKKGKFKLLKVKGKARKQEATPEVDQGIDTPNIDVKGTHTKKSLFGKLHFPDVELDIKSPKLKGDGSLAEGFKSPDTSVSSDSAKICLEGPDVNVKGGPELSARTSGQSASGLQYPEGTIQFPKIKVPKFGILQPKVEGQNVPGKGKSDAMMGGKLDLEGESGVSLSAKGKSASLDLFKKSKHRSSSASDEGSLAVSSPSALSEAESGDISIDVGGTKVKGKKGKLKFGTFGGFGSKSKGSYEVTLGNDNEGETEGSTDASVPLKKSRLSSSSSSDSGSRGAFRLPKLELSVSPKK
ncbi:neuroblast differentiation-associated protein AHNAK [Poecilia latipinna]|uniref:neuroblast differentiation-associated protein AHNAK n=1 Tax=Poecilia latipinna TaxID=48699 RepID=UPI00072EE619|nr:PREDICTED: neuroblast differentiation-associated protein AHNAK-like [Poecilia latipinna]